MQNTLPDTRRFAVAFLSDWRGVRRKRWITAATQSFRAGINVGMTISPAPIQIGPSTRELGTKRSMPFSCDHHFNDFDSRASTSFSLSDSVMSEIDAALKLFRGVLSTRQDFINVATLFALESLKNDPKVALRKLAATGAVTEVARMDDRHGLVDGESL